MTAFQPIIFNLGDELYGINIINVRAIEQTQTIVRVPNSSSNIKGIINLRGEVIPVIDLKAKLLVEMLSYNHSFYYVVLGVLCIHLRYSPKNKSILPSSTACALPDSALVLWSFTRVYGCNM